MQKLSVDFKNHISQDSHKTQYLSLVCIFGFTAPQYSKFKFVVKCHIFLIDNAHRSYPIACAITWFTLWLVRNQLQRVGIIHVVGGNIGNLLMVSPVIQT